MTKVFTINAGRSCNGCTACCEGWLTGVAYGYEFSPGIKCKFLSHKSCAIYQVRPYNPCKTFQCQWKINTNIPEWMRPDLSGAILLPKYIKPHHYIRIVATGKIPNSRVFEWAKEFSETGANIVAYDGNNIVIYSKSEEFKKAIKDELN